MATSFPPLLPILQRVPDPRRGQGRRYPLPAILSLMCVAAMSGYTSYSAMTEWGQHYGVPSLHLLGFSTDRAPCKSWLSQLLPRLDVAALEVQLSEWVESVWAALPPEEGEDEVIAIDGKVLRGSRKAGAPGAYLLAALGCRLGMTYHQCVVLEEERKPGDPHPSEIPAMKALLDDLFRTGRLRDRIWTMDALHTQCDNAEKIVEGGGDYVMVVKGNQPTLQQDIDLLFASRNARVIQGETSETVELAHGRQEIRQILTSTALNDYLDWPGVGQVFRIHRKRQDRKSGKVSEETVHGITSLTPGCADARRILDLVRCHWHIENRLHWVRDVTFGEDRSTLRRENTPEIMAAIHNTAISLIRLVGYENIAKGRRHFAAQPREAIDQIGIAT